MVVHCVEQQSDTLDTLVNVGDGLVGEFSLGSVQVLNLQSQ